MARITYTGDLGRAPMPSTIDLLWDHKLDCYSKVERLRAEADRLIASHGVRAEGVIQGLYNEIGKWLEQARQAEMSIALIKRGVKEWKGLSYHGRNQK